jgi:hypothetical protein
MTGGAIPSMRRLGRAVERWSRRPRSWYRGEAERDAHRDARPARAARAMAVAILALLVLLGVLLVYLVGQPR